MSGAVLFEAAGLRAVDLACYAADGGLGLPLFGGGVVEDLAQRAAHQGGSSFFFSSFFWRSIICSMSCGRPRSISSLCSSSWRISDSSLQVVQVVDEPLEVRGGDVERQFLAAIAVGDEVAGAEHAAGPAQLELVRDALQRLIQGPWFAVQHQLLREHREAHLVRLAVDVLEGRILSSSKWRRNSVFSVSSWLCSSESGAPRPGSSPNSMLAGWPWS